VLNKLKTRLKENAMPDTYNSLKKSLENKYACSKSLIEAMDMDLHKRLEQIKEQCH
jgi:hypothetical protein